MGTDMPMRRAVVIDSSDDDEYDAEFIRMRAAKDKALLAKMAQKRNAPACNSSERTIATERCCGEEAEAQALKSCDKGDSSLADLVEATIRGQLVSDQSFMTELREQGFKCVRLPEAALSVVSTVMEHSETIFGADKSVKQSLHPPEDLERDEMDASDLGYRVAKTDQFIDLRASGGQLVPQSEQIEQCSPGWTAAAHQLISVMTIVARVVLEQLCAELKISPNAFLETVECGTEMTNACLRMCKYAPAGNTTQKVGEVAFKAHTDTTFITLGLCSMEPGLEIQQGRGQWVTPEQGRDLRDVLIMPGEVAEILTRGYVKASMHRVVRPRNPRLSLPFLVRTIPKSIVNTKLHIQAAREQGQEPDGRLLSAEGQTVERLWNHHGGWIRHYCMA